MFAIRGLSRGSAAQIIPLFALTLVIVLAGMAIVLDGGRVYAERRKTQNAADAAAMAGAAKLVKSDIAGSTPAVLAAACSAAFANGGYGTGAVDSQCGTSGTVVTVHIPLAGGTPGTIANVNPKFDDPNTGYVQVGITTSFRSFMAGLVGLSNFATSAIAVAVNSPGNGLGDVLLVLDPTSCESLQINGSNALNISGGNVQVDSAAAKSSDSACSNKNAATTAGGATLNNPGNVNNIVGSGDATGVTPAWTTAAYKPDPLTRVSVPPFDKTAPIQGGPGTWDHPQPWTAMGTVTATPGVYWGGITVTNGDNLTLSPGTYIMAGGGFNIQGGTVNGPATGGVTLIYTMDPYCNSTVGGCSSSLQKNGDLDGNHLNGGSSAVGQGTGATVGSWGTSALALNPQILDPDPYSLSRILIYIDRNALAQDSTTIPCPATTLNIGGNGYFNFADNSIVYAPCGIVDLHGTSVPPSHGGAVVAWQVVISGTKDFNLGGPAIGSYPTAQSNLVQ